MGPLPEVVAALADHCAVRSIVDHALALLYNLATEDANRVSAGDWRWAHATMRFLHAASTPTQAVCGMWARGASRTMGRAPISRPEYQRFVPTAPTPLFPVAPGRPR